ncbi:MAG: hypothetical protein AAF358_09355 [Pseudomonadota bacterium]
MPLYNDRLQVCGFSKPLFGRIVRQVLAGSNVDLRAIFRKKQVSYLIGYLSRQKALSVVIEKEYVDRHFLEDYANFHVRSHRDFGKLCTRLHFFSGKANPSHNRPFYRKELIALIRGQAETSLSQSSLSEAYLGFVVVRPLENALVGRTCLNTYSPGDKATDECDSRALSREYKTTTSESVNLFGLELTIPTTLPFQEQDSSVAACASSALWSYFYGVPTSRKTQIPSPSSITRMAQSWGRAKDFRLSGTHGLTPDLVKNALAAFDLEYVQYAVSPTRVDSKNSPSFRNNRLRALIYAYQARKREPLLLGVDVYKRCDGKLGPKLDGHLITVTGFEYAEDLRIAGDPGSELYGHRNSACSIRKLYCHDDALGPFARLTFEAVENSEGDVLEVLCPYVVDTGSGGKSNAGNLVDDLVYVPRTVHLGLYHKIRNPFRQVLEDLLRFRRYIQSLIMLIGSDPYWTMQNEACWELFLVDQNDYKAEMLDVSKQVQSEDLKDEMFELLVSRLPRFFWCIRYRTETITRFDILVDATSSSGGASETISAGMIGVVSHDTEWFRRLTLAYESMGLKTTKQEFESSAETLDMLLAWEQFIKQRQRLPLADRIFGDLAFPTEIYSHEEKNLYELRKPAQHFCISRNYSVDVEVTLKQLDRQTVYNWVVDEFGDIYVGSLDVIGEDSDGTPMELGHPTLINGAPARIAGELRFLDERWSLNNNSGRYAMDKENRGPSEVEAVKRFLDSRGFTDSANEIFVDVD